MMVILHNGVSGNIDGENSRELFYALNHHALRCS